MLVMGCLPPHPPLPGDICKVAIDVGCWALQDYDARTPEQFDGCIANILAGPLVELAPLISAAVRPGGWLALSGILASQVSHDPDSFCQCFSMGFANALSVLQCISRCERAPLTTPT